jgi:hypothetical protein
MGSKYNWISLNSSCMQCHTIFSFRCNLIAQNKLIFSFILFSIIMHCSMEPKWDHAKFMHNYDYFQHLKRRVGFFFQSPLENPLERIPTLITLHQNMANMFTSKTRFVVSHIYPWWLCMWLCNQYNTIVIFLSIVINFICNYVLHDYIDKTHIWWPILINLGCWIN